MTRPMEYREFWEGGRKYAMWDDPAPTPSASGCTRQKTNHMTHERMLEIARKRAGYALAKIADMQMSTWLQHPKPTPTEVIAAQMMEAMNDALTDERNA